MEGRMRKSVIAVTVGLVGMLVATPMATAAQSTGDAKKACADIVEGRAAYQSVFEGTTITGSQLQAQMDLGAAACKNVTYTMTVLASEIDPTVLASTLGAPVPAAADGSPPRVVFSSGFSLPAPAGVCVVITTSKSNGTVLDRAPDVGCIAIALDSEVSGLQRFR